MRVVATLSTAALIVAVLGGSALGQTTGDPGVAKDQDRKTTAKTSDTAQAGPPAQVNGDSIVDLQKRIKELEAQRDPLAAKADPQAGQAAATDPQVAALEKKIKELEARIDAIIKDRDAPPEEATNRGDVDRVMDPVGLRSFYADGYLLMASPKGRFIYWLDGRVNLDYASYQGADNRLPTGVEVRRARLGLKTTLWTNWLAEVDLDFADGKVSFKDLWMGRLFENGLIRAGNHKAPFSLDTLTSSKNIVFIERSYLDAMSPDRRIGVSYSGWGKWYQYSGGVFFQEAGLFNDKDTLTGGGAGTDQKVNLVGRFTVAPIAKRDKVLHFGIGAAYRRPDVSKIATSGADLVDRENAAMIVKLDSRAETHVSRAKFLSTGDMKYVDHFTQFNVELAGTYGPLTFQSEYLSTKVNRIPTTVAAYSNHSFGGYYAQVSWFLTGDHRPYSVAEGEFYRVIPKRKYGAVEAGLRYNVMDLDDATTVDPILGGGAKNVTLGLSWFVNANHKLMFNVVKVNNNANARPGKDWAPIPPGTSTAQTVIYGDDFTTIAVRYQIAF